MLERSMSRVGHVQVIALTVLVAASAASDARAQAGSTIKVIEAPKPPPHEAVIVSQQHAQAAAPRAAPAAATVRRLSCRAAHPARSQRCRATP
jgi:hypothetical protein